MINNQTLLKGQCVTECFHFSQWQLPFFEYCQYTILNTKTTLKPTLEFHSNGFIKFAICLVIMKTFETISEMLTGQ